MTEFELDLALDTVPRIFFADGFSSKKRALEALATIFARQSELSITDILDSFMKRERLGSTAIGDGIAIPHGRIENFTQAMGAIIIVANGVNFEARDNAPIEIIFGLLVPNESCEQHLSLLQGIASIASVPASVNLLKTEKSAEKLYQWITTNHPQLGDILK